jgi:hypothetical protein
VEAVPLICELETPLPELVSTVFALFWPPALRSFEAVYALARAYAQGFYPVRLPWVARSGPYGRKMLKRSSQAF